jgi:hypothetical protein
MTPHAWVLLPQSDFASFLVTRTIALGSAALGPEAEHASALLGNRVLLFADAYIGGVKKASIAIMLHEPTLDSIVDLLARAQGRSNDLAVIWARPPPGSSTSRPDRKYIDV